MTMEMGVAIGLLQDVFGPCCFLSRNSGRRSVLIASPAVSARRLTDVLRSRTSVKTSNFRARRYDVGTPRCIAVTGRGV